MGKTKHKRKNKKGKTRSKRGGSGLCGGRDIDECAKDWAVWTDDFAPATRWSNEYKKYIPEHYKCQWRPATTWRAARCSKTSGGLIASLGKKTRASDPEVIAYKAKTTLTLDPDLPIVKWGDAKRREAAGRIKYNNRFRDLGVGDKPTEVGFLDLKREAAVAAGAAGTGTYGGGKSRKNNRKNKKRKKSKRRRNK
jgi:hypothetical protein